MLKRLLLPPQDNFFNLFQQTVDKLVLTATEFCRLVENLSNAQSHVDVIAKHEQEADQIALATFELLHKTFITPFDRNDIHQLTSSLDDIIDLINRIAQRFPFYQLETVPVEIINLAKLSADATWQLKSSVYCLHSLKNTHDIIKYCNEIDNLESKAHAVVLMGEQKLFAQENDFKQFFKLKEIYAHCKLVINRCQDVANIVRGIMLEYS